jgi:hypothetical protein
MSGDLYKNLKTRAFTFALQHIGHFCQSSLLEILFIGLNALASDRQPFSSLGHAANEHLTQSQLTGKIG